jgi:hypothetical protein
VSSDPVVRLLADLDQPARPTAEFQDALLARLLGELEGANRPEREAQVDASSNGWRARVLRAARRRPGRTMLAFAAVAGAAAAALFVSSPWKTAPGFSLERAQAVLTPPEGTILHAAWTVTRKSQDYGCTVTLGPNEVWADLSPPYGYRHIESLWPSAEAADRRSAACSSHVTTESGGRPGTALRFVPPDKLVPYGPGWIGESMDDVALLRKALAEGTAQDEGQVELDGRIVERIRVDLAPGGPRLFYYVDRETFIPVRVDSPGGAFWDWLELRFDVVRHYSTYEYLPRTDENLALTDIRKQHPDATGPPTLRGAVAKTVLAAEGAKSAPVTFEVTATDDDGVDIPVSCQPGSGSRFPLGVTTVQCAATDASGNTNTASFTVTVLPASSSS